MPYTVSISDGVVSSQLAKSSQFQARLETQMVKKAHEVVVETGVGSNHAARFGYAKTVLAASAAETAKVSLYMAQSTNVVTAGITLDDSGVRTAATDADLFSQINTDWNKFAGIDLGN